MWVSIFTLSRSRVATIITKTINNHEKVSEGRNVINWEIPRTIAIGIQTTRTTNLKMKRR
jgi:hypothetical protein